MDVKKIRTKLFLTQEEFAKVFGVHVQTVRCWEWGKFQPSLKQQKKILEFAKKHNIEVD